MKPLAPHEHWHVDVSHINICGIFFFLCSLLEGCSRAIVPWEIREAMTEADVEIMDGKRDQSSPRTRGVQCKTGSNSGVISTSMLRATPGCRRISPARSRVSTIW